MRRASRRASPEWMWEENEAMLLEYPFIAEIDAEHIVGGAGHLYCIVPVDENASVSIKPHGVEQEYMRLRGVQRPLSLGDRRAGAAVSKSRRRSLRGRHAGIDNRQQREIPVNGGRRSTRWAVLPRACRRMETTFAFDFTEYGWLAAPLDLAPWLAEGWSGMTALGLAGSEDWGMGWFVETTAWETDLPAYFSLRFYLEDETGGMVELDWFYNDSDTADESWFGFWTIETVLDGPSYVTLDISLVGGQNYDETADPIYLEETYPMLISPSGTELLIAKGETGICLPFMSQSTTACTLTLIEG